VVVLVVRFVLISPRQGEIPFLLSESNQREKW